MSIEGAGRGSPNPYKYEGNSDKTSHASSSSSKSSKSSESSTTSKLSAAFVKAKEIFTKAETSKSSSPLSGGVKTRHMIKTELEALAQEAQEILHKPLEPGESPHQLPENFRERLQGLYERGVTSKEFWAAVSAAPLPSTSKKASSTSTTPAVKLTPQMKELLNTTAKQTASYMRRMGIYHMELLPSDIQANIEILEKAGVTTNDFYQAVHHAGKKMKTKLPLPYGTTTSSWKNFESPHFKQSLETKATTAPKPKRATPQTKATATTSSHAKSETSSSSDDSISSALSIGGKVRTTVDKLLQQRESEPQPSTSGTTSDAPDQPSPFQRQKGIRKKEHPFKTTPHKETSSASKASSSAAAKESTTTTTRKATGRRRPLTSMPSSTPTSSQKRSKISPQDLLKASQLRQELDEAKRRIDSESSSNEN